MATATSATLNIITDSLNLQIVKTIPLNKIEDVFVELGFDVNDIEKRRVVAQLSSSINRLIMDLLSSWKNKHGCGLDEAEKLKGAMQKHGVDGAVKLIQEAINKVIPPPPQLDPLVEASSTKSASDRPSPLEAQ